MRHWLVLGICSLMLACTQAPSEQPIIEADQGPRPSVQPTPPPPPKPLPTPTPKPSSNGNSNGIHGGGGGGGGGGSSSGGGGGGSTGPYAFELTILEGSPVPPDQISVQEASP